MMKNLVKQSAKLMHKAFNIPRDARYVITLIWSLLLFSLMLLQALHAGWFDGFEKPVFHFFNNLPHWLGPVMYFITQFGSFGGLIVWMAVAWYLINRKAALSVLFGGSIGWIAAKIAKAAVHRGRPQEFLHHIHLFRDHIYSGYGFPSGHATFSAACAMVLYYQVRPKYRKYLVFTVLLVGISRMYLGAHFPLDVVGGWALGIASGSIAVLLVGTSTKLLSAQTIKRVLTRKGYSIASAKFANLDARGSRALFITTTAGIVYFGKVVGDREFAADWLFKVYRFFRYKNLQAEEPFLNGRRTIELESLANLWARKAGVRSPDIIDIIKIGRHWLLLQESINAQPLADIKRVKTISLEDAWRQVTKLHAANMAHRDLRASNVMIDTQGKAWIIDYGFAEVAPNAARKSMDIAELLMSMSLVFGVERTLDTALKIVGKDSLKRALIYVHRSVFSGATNQAIRCNKHTLHELRSSLKERLRFKGEVAAPNIDRLNRRKLLIGGLLAVFAYIIIPQLVQFKHAFGALHDVSYVWLMAAVVGSAVSYVAAGAVYVALASVPLKLREATLVQLAGSFMSKIIPAGLGATSLNAKYLINAGLDATQATALIVGQSFISMLMFVVPLGIFLLVGGQSIGSLFSVYIKSSILIAVAIGVLVVAGVLYVRKPLRQRVQDIVVRFIAQLRDMSSSPRELALGAAASLAITGAYVACLYASIHALHATLSIGVAILIYATAIIAKTAVPTPGGLGPVEVSLASALIGAGLPSPQAFGIVIIYRLATFWLPIPLSFFAYRFIMKRNIV